MDEASERASDPSPAGMARDCGRRGKCPYEGKLCASIQLKNGVLNKREIEILKRIGQGKLDKDICVEMFMAKDTLRYHKDQISDKAGTLGKIALAVLAYQLNLV